MLTFNPTLHIQQARQSFSSLSMTFATFLILVDWNGI